MPRWILPENQSDEGGIFNLGGGQLLKQLLTERGITEPGDQQAFLDPVYYLPSPPDALPGVKEAIPILLDSLDSGRRIGVWGDFDVDGQTSTTLLVSALRNLGAEVEYHIPVRATESHGIKIDSLKEFLQKNIDVLLTCDTGISEHASIAFARDAGVEVIITDHHDLPTGLPAAEAVINPKLLAQDHPLASLPGVGVAFKLIEAVYTELDKADELPGFLDLVALGIVADVAEMVHDTRYLLQLGLQQLRQTNRLGLNVMFELADVDQRRITEEDIGFSIGPRLNALGRLGDANRIVEFLTTDDPGFADVFAHQLEGMNAQRKLLSSQVLQGALAQLERNPDLGSQSVIVLGSEHWPPGVIGIVAGKLAERFNKPVILLQYSEGGLARGSARSIDGIDIGKAIRSCDNLLINYGGHPMAAGLSLQMENLQKFRSRLSASVIEQTGVDAAESKIKVDLVVELDDLTLPLVQEIMRMAPFGPGNPPVMFAAKNLSIVNHTLIGRFKTHRRLILEDGSGTQQSALWWDGAEWDLPQVEFDMAFTVRQSYFRGEESIQVVVEDIRSDAPAPAQIDNRIDIFDYRNEDDPFSSLETLADELQDVIVWGEGKFRKPGHILGREEITPAPNLIIWSIPPAFQVLKLVIEKVQPARLFLFGNDPGMDEVEPFLSRLAGLVKFVVANKGGNTTIPDLAQAVAQTEAITQLGLSWLEAQGKITVMLTEDGMLKINLKPSGNLTISSEAVSEELTMLMRESKLFREYYQNTPVQSFIESVGDFAYRAS